MGNFQTPARRALFVQPQRKEKGREGECVAGFRGFHTCSMLSGAAVISPFHPSHPTSCMPSTHFCPGLSTCHRVSEVSDQLAWNLCVDLDASDVLASRGGNNRAICGGEDGLWMAFMMAAVGGKMVRCERKSVAIVLLGLGERATASRRVTREPCDWDETGRLEVSARGQRARPVAHPPKPPTLDGW